MKITSFDNCSGFDFVTTDGQNRFSVYYYDDKVQVEIFSVDAAREVTARPPRSTSYFIDFDPVEWERLVSVINGDK